MVIVCYDKNCHVRRNNYCSFICNYLGKNNVQLGYQIAMGAMGIWQRVYACIVFLA